MHKKDERFQSLGQLHKRRKQAVRLHRQGLGVMRIVDWVQRERATDVNMLLIDFLRSL